MCCTGLLVWFLCLQLWWTMQEDSKLRCTATVSARLPTWTRSQRRASYSRMPTMTSPPAGLQYWQVANSCCRSTDTNQNKIVVTECDCMTNLVLHSDSGLPSTKMGCTVYTIPTTSSPLIPQSLILNKTGDIFWYGIIGKKQHDVHWTNS